MAAAVDNKQFTISDHFLHLKKTKDSTGACFWDLGNLIDLLISTEIAHASQLLRHIGGSHMWLVRNFDGVGA